MFDTAPCSTGLLLRVNKLYLIMNIIAILLYYISVFSCMSLNVVSFTFDKSIGNILVSFGEKNLVTRIFCIKNGVRVRPRKEVGSSLYEESKISLTKFKQCLK